MRAHPGPMHYRKLRRGALLLLLMIAGSLTCGVSNSVAQSPDINTRALPAPHPDPDRLRGGWYPWDPYQYRDYRRDVPILTGFDIEIERALERLIGMEILLPEVSWQDQLTGIADGTMDIAAGAVYSDARNAYAYFSKPYRTETDVLILRKGASAGYPFRTVEGMLDTFVKQKFRLGVIAGYIYADPRISAFIADPANKDQILPVAGDAQNLRNLIAGLIDGFLADRIAASTTAWRRDEGNLIEEHPLRFTADIHFMLSRATQTPQMVARLDNAIDELKRSGEFRRIVDFYALPVLIHQTLDSEWFRILVFLGTVAFALSGIVLAYSGQYTFFGALILAALPAVGGGVVRDLILQREPLGIVRDPVSLLTVFGTVLAGMIVIKSMSYIRAGFTKRLASGAYLGTRFIEIFDAVALAAFTVVGVIVALDTTAQPLWLWGPIAAVLTASFGGLMRDLFRQDRILANLRGELYPEIAAVWGLALALFFEWEGARLQTDEIRLAVIVTLLGAFLTRVVAIARGMKGWPYV